MNKRSLLGLGLPFAIAIGAAGCGADRAQKNENQPASGVEAEGIILQDANIGSVYPTTGTDGVHVVQDARIGLVSPVADAVVKAEQMYHLSEASIGLTAPVPLVVESIERAKAGTEAQPTSP